MSVCRVMARNSRCLLSHTQIDFEFAAIVYHNVESIQLLYNHSPRNFVYCKIQIKHRTIAIRGSV